MCLMYGMCIVYLMHIMLLWCVMCITCAVSLMCKIIIGILYMIEAGSQIHFPLGIKLLFWLIGIGMLAKLGFGPLIESVIKLLGTIVGIALFYVVKIICKPSSSSSVKK